MLNSDTVQNKKIYVGLSGGVDSAVSAYLLKADGYDVTGIFIKTWQPDYIACTWKNDRLDAMRICAQLDIPFKTLDLEKEYKEHVIDYMLSEYKNNKTPNPDIMCNKYIKFDGFLKYAKENGAMIATGHYAKIDNNFLVTHIDKSKDQSYFLYQIKKENLKDIIFPLTNLEKKEVRNIAKENNLYVAEKKESMGICMLGDISMKDFLVKELKPQVGNVCNELEEVIGIHYGVILYTIGERHGFTVNKKEQDKNNTSLPYFVYEKNYENNILYVAQDENKIFNLNKNNQDNSVTLKEINSFIDLSEIDENKIYLSQNRYHGPLYEVVLKVEKDKNNYKIKIVAKNKQNFFAVSGQSAAIFENENLILGGIIN